ncbi:MAG: hypothetical protein JNJ71_15500 [Rubrivivax sp.]|nr:hypothetical protein [Rubrivivax sp.]
MAANDGFDDAVLGRGLPPAAEAALAEAGAWRTADASRAMAALMRAQALAPQHPAVLIALYRHHFFGHRLAAARDVARRALVVAAQALDLPPVWREVKPFPLPDARTDSRSRFYLFLLKGYAYLSLRLDDAGEARDALALLSKLDPQDHVGGSVLEAVRVRALVGEPAEIDGPPTVTGAAAWVRARQGLDAPASPT